MNLLDQITVQPKFPHEDVDPDNAELLVGALTDFDKLKLESFLSRDARISLKIANLALDEVCFRIDPGRGYKAMRTGINIFEVALHRVAPPERVVGIRKARHAGQILSRGTNKEGQIEYVQGSETVIRHDMPVLVAATEQLAKSHHRSHVVEVVKGLAVARQLELDMVD